MLNQFVQATPKEEAIFRRLYDLGRIYFPGQTTQAENWIQEQAAKYGLVYGKIQAEERGRELWNSPLTWLAVGVGAFLLLRR